MPQTCNTSAINGTDNGVLSQSSAVRMTPQNDGLTYDQTATFLEVVDASLRISRRDQLFSWLQGSCQYLVPHEVLICGVRLSGENEFRFDSFVSTRYVTDPHVEAVTDADGVVTRAIAAWRRERRPVAIADDLAEGDYGKFAVPFVEPEGALRASELRNLLLHCMGSQDGGIATVFAFSRVPGKIQSSHAYLLELLVPHLHAVVTRVISHKDGAGSGEMVSPITAREREILQWVHKGKTNWEIAGILDISPLTVKNHVQNILRKLNVQNRSHAAVKASQLGLVQV